MFNQGSKDVVSLGARTLKLQRANLHHVVSCCGGIPRQARAISTSETIGMSMPMERSPSTSQMPHRNRKRLQKPHHKPTEEIETITIRLSGILGKRLSPPL